jgi:hypothetical protein
MRLVWALALASCAERPASDGSELAAPVTWTAEARLAGAELDGHQLGPLPPDTLSVTVMAEATDGALSSLEIRDPAGHVLVDARDPEGSPNRVLRGRGRVVAMLPSASATLPLASDYLVAPARLAGAAVPVTLSAWVKRGGGGRQELPLAVLEVGIAVDEAAVDRALGEVGRIWRAAGIEVREPLRLRVDGAEAQALGRVEVDPALASDSPMVARALALSARAPADALSLVLVGDVAVAGPGYPIWAVAGGIPVPPVSGTPRSGVVVSAVLLERDPLFAGQVMAHEMGHALGLYHTTEGELDGGEAIGDQIDDTTGCPASADLGPQDGMLDAQECDPFDTSNLMFWTAVRGATALTPGQAAIARRSALAR